jgi:RND family efflux transporter MFP subunit
VLCYLEGKTVDEAAAQLGCPRGTVASRLARGRVRLGTRLVRRGLILSGAAVTTALGQAGPATGASPALIGSALQFITTQSVTKAATAGASARVIALTEEVLRAMSMKRLTSVTVVIVSAGLLFLGGGLGLQWFGGPGGEPAPRAAAAQAQSPEPEKPQPKDTSPAKDAPTVRQPVQREFTPFEDFTGRLEAARTVDVLARATGYLVKVRCDPGAAVKKGDVLFEIEDTRPKEALAKAEANSAAAGARRRLSQADLSRANAHLKKGSIAKEEWDRCASSAEIDAALFKVAELEVKRARRELDATKVTAAADGKLGQLLVSSGNLVSADKTVLARIVQADQLHVVFDMDERSFGRLQSLLRDGQVKRKSPLFMGLVDDDGFPHKGTVASFDDQFNPNTGTIRVRGIFPNPDRRLLPGMFARVRMPLGKPRKVLEVADAAIGTEQGKNFVLIINPDNVVERRPVKTGQRDGDMRVVEQGLRHDDWVVVNGISRLAPNTRVVPRRKE